MIKVNKTSLLLIKVRKLNNNCVHRALKNGFYIIKQNELFFSGSGGGGSFGSGFGMGFVSTGSGGWLGFCCGAGFGGGAGFSSSGGAGFVGGGGFSFGGGGTGLSFALGGPGGGPCGSR
jgi:hypothetical protein